MDNTNTLLFVESRYQVNRKRIAKTVATMLSEQGVSRSVEVSIAIVGDRKMRELNRKYRNLEKTSNVLSFSLSEGKAVAMPDQDVLRLGDVVISYPQAIAEAAEDDVMVDEKIDELLQHGLLHLLGQHHEE